jgi:hypothetical protein
MRGRWSCRSSLAWRRAEPVLRCQGFQREFEHRGDPGPMLVVCQVTDVREVCEAGRGAKWRALHWKGGDERKSCNCCRQGGDLTARCTCFFTHASARESSFHSGMMLFIGT